MCNGSVTGAANLLHISQPSVGRLITDLEEPLGFSLFTRTGHGLVFPPERLFFTHKRCSNNRKIFFPRRNFAFYQPPITNILYYSFPIEFSTL